MAAPSVHPSGVVYQIEQDTPLLRLGAPQVSRLFPFVSSNKLLAEGGALQHSRKKKTVGEDLIGRIKAARPVSVEAESLTQLKGREDHYYGRCPFHDDAKASFWVDDAAGLWGCYAASCSTNATGVRAHDVINLRMWAQGISNREAIRQLAEEVLPSRWLSRQSDEQTRQSRQ